MYLHRYWARSSSLDREGAVRLPSVRTALGAAQSSLFYYRGNLLHFYAANGRPECLSLSVGLDLTWRHRIFHPAGGRIFRLRLTRKYPISLTRTKLQLKCSISTLPGATCELKALQRVSKSDRQSRNPHILTETHLTLIPVHMKPTLI